MPILVYPTPAHEAEVLRYRAEFLQNGDSLDGTNNLQKYDHYADWLAAVRRCESDDTVPSGLVPATLFLAVRPQDGRLVGMIDIRHRLNDSLLNCGGHIGYSVRPGERRKGYAKKMLRLALEQCASLGTRRALVTCDKQNEASRRTVLACGGTLENEISHDGRVVQRFWIDVPLSVRPAAPEDAPAICRLNRLALGYDYPEADTSARVSELLAGGRDRIWVACEGEIMLGYLHAADYDTTYTGRQKNIMALAVDPERQGRGVGRALLGAVERWARQDGCAGVRLVSGMNRTGAHAFYEACGYFMRKEQKNFVKQW